MDCILLGRGSRLIQLRLAGPTSHLSWTPASWHQWQALGPPPAWSGPAGRVVARASFAGTCVPSSRKATVGDRWDLWDMSAHVAVAPLGLLSAYILAKAAASSGLALAGRSPASAVAPCGSPGLRWQRKRSWDLAPRTPRLRCTGPWLTLHGSWLRSSPHGQGA